MQDIHAYIFIQNKAFSRKKQPSFCESIGEDLEGVAY